MKGTAMDSTKYISPELNTVISSKPGKVEQLFVFLFAFLGCLSCLASIEAIGIYAVPVSAAIALIISLQIEKFFVFLFAFLGCLACSVLVNVRGIYAVPAAATIALLIGLLGAGLRFKGDYSLAAYAGAFGGMSQIPVEAHVLTRMFCLSILVALVVLCFERLAPKYPKLALSGVGGRLGFFGFLGSTLFSALVLGKGSNYHSSLIDARQVVISAIAIVFGAAATTAIRIALSKDTPHNNVIASAATGIAGSAVLIVDHEYSGMVAADVFLGSFIGMSTLSSLSTNFIVLSSMIATVILNLANSFFFGFGGLLGIISTFSVLLSRLIAVPMPAPDLDRAGTKN
jgi:hypothetical protein